MPAAQHFQPQDVLYAPADFFCMKIVTSFAHHRQTQLDVFLEAGFLVLLQSAGHTAQHNHNTEIQQLQDLKSTFYLI